MIRIELPFDRWSSEDHVWVRGDTDFERLARRLCAAEQEVWPSTDPRWDPDPEPLLRAYRTLCGTPFAASLAAAVEGCARDPRSSQAVRAVAQHFIDTIK